MILGITGSLLSVGVLLFCPGCTPTEEPDAPTTETPQTTESPTPDTLTPTPTPGPHQSPEPTPTPEATPEIGPTPTPGPMTSPTPVPWELARSDKARQLNPSPDDIPELVVGNSAFALDLYQSIRAAETANFFYSPYSISVALAMTYAGARGETEAQMAHALHFTLSQDLLHPAFNALDLDLARRSEQTGEQEGSPFQLRIANSIWGQSGYPFEVPFLDIMAESYGAGLRLLDFFNQPDESRLIINGWVLDQTEGKIKDLIPEGAISPDTKLVLANAIYFNASWTEPFDEEATTTGVFYAEDGSAVNVPMMSQTGDLRYAAGDGFHAVELPYIGDKVAMLIVVPDSNGFVDFETNFTLAKLDSIVGSLNTFQLDLTLPKWTDETRLTTLTSILVALGMPDAMSPSAADFSGISTATRLFISAVVHKAFVAVDETGTEAAAATAIIMNDTGIPPSATLTINRPFLYLIRDIPTGAILFVGRVLDPSP